MHASEEPNYEHTQDMIINNLMRPPYVLLINRVQISSLNLFSKVSFSW